MAYAQSISDRAIDKSLSLEAAMKVYDNLMV